MKRVLGILLVSALFITCFAVPTLAASSSGGDGGADVLSTAAGGALAASKKAVGTWTYHKDVDKWTFKDQSGVQYKSRWAQVYNPYSKNSDKYEWFYFDEQGYMKTGWVWIKGSDGKAKCYYFNTKSNGSLGACQQGGFVTDTTGTWTLGADGAWINNRGAVATK